MKKRESYSGEYDGVVFELVKWGKVKNIGSDFEWSDFNPTWCLYLILFIDGIPEKYDPKSFLLKPREFVSPSGNKRETYDYYDHPILNNINLHGGITFYELIGKNCIRVGCDYAHYGDNSSDFSFEYLFEDAKNAIASFKERIPDYKYWCCGNGKLYNKNEGVIRNDTFYSKEYYESKHPEWFNNPETIKEGV